MFKFKNQIETMLLLSIITLIANNQVSAQRETWGGKWFPNSPFQPENNPIVNDFNNNLYDSKHGVKMGILDPDCDDGKSKLEVDWDFNPINYTCFSPVEKLLYRSRSENPAEYSADNIPPEYNAHHHCMNSSIHYSNNLPTFGSHRPLWAKWGEYTFLPRQRWLHNLEHGGIVMLYHPCADGNEVNILRKLVKNCLYRHIITPYTLLAPEHPLAILAWGHRLEISKVDPTMVIDFIKEHARHGPEQMSKDGQYSLLLATHAEIVSDIRDHQLCKLFEAIEK